MSQVLRSHQTADVGPGQHLGHHPGLRPDVRLSCSQVHQYRAQDGTYQHPAWDPQPHQQQAAPPLRRPRSKVSIPSTHPISTISTGMVIKQARVDRVAPVAAYLSSAPKSPRHYGHLTDHRQGALHYKDLIGQAGNAEQAAHARTDQR